MSAFWRKVRRCLWGLTAALALPTLAGERAEVRASFAGRAVEVCGCRVSAVPYNRVWPGRQRPDDQSKRAAFMSFDVTERGTFSLVLPRDAKTVRVRPFRRDQGRLADGVFTTDVSHPESFVVEAGGTEYHVFAEPPWTYVPRKGDLYFGPGEHDAGAIVARSGERIVLDRGARVFGTLLLMDVENVVIEGRGILDTSRLNRVDLSYSGSREIARRSGDETAVSGPAWGTAPVYARQARRVSLSGITFVDSPRWTMNIDRCDDFVIDGVKLVGLWRYNSDGIDICDSRNVVVRNSFVRSFDDCVIARPPTYAPSGTELRNVVVSNCVLWCDWGQCMKIQHAQLPSVMGDIVMRDISCVNVANSAAQVTTRWGSAGSVVRNVLFEDIRVDVQPNRLKPKMQPADGVPYAPEPEPLLRLVQVDAYSLGTPAPNQGAPGRLDPDFFRIDYDGLRFRHFSVYGATNGVRQVACFETAVPRHTIGNVELADMPPAMELVTKGNVDISGCVRLRRRICEDGK